MLKLNSIKHSTEPLEIGAKLNAAWVLTDSNGPRQLDTVVLSGTCALDSSPLSYFKLI